MSTNVFSPSLLWKANQSIPGYSQQVHIRYALKQKERLPLARQGPEVLSPSWPKVDAHIDPARSSDRAWDDKSGFCLLEFFPLLCNRFVQN
jgi:hypothetical protein